MGCCADLPVSVGAALAIGACAGLVSTLGFSKLQKIVEKNLGIHDTCGILNLHGMPAIIGGVCGAIAAAAFNEQSFNGMSELDKIYPAVASGGRSFGNQGLYQILYLAISVAVAVVSGTVVGLFVQVVYPIEDDEYYRDSKSWEVPELETPYFFDVRGEVEHQGGKNDTNKGLGELKKRLEELETSFGKPQ